jgi:hypothetical protein
MYFWALGRLASHCLGTRDLNRFTNGRAQDCHLVEVIETEMIFFVSE